MYGIFGILAGAVIFAMPSMAADDAAAAPTFTKDVLPILQENCQTCHRPAGWDISGMIAPMSLMTYREVRPWAKSIEKAVSSKVMPPWDATYATHGVFANERTLTDEEIQTVVAWVKGGARRGNPADAPEPMQFNESGWTFGEADLVVPFTEPFFVNDDVQDLYHNVIVPITAEQLPEDKWLSSIEFKSGSEVVHHVILYANGPGSSGRGRGSMIGGNAPGTDRADWPEGYGILLKKGTTLRFEMHYHKEAGAGTGVWDTSSVAFKFHDGPVDHPITFSTIAHGAFEIPPAKSAWRVGGARTFQRDTWLLAMLPHMHLRGKAAKYTAYYPDGTVEQLLDVPEYDFNWQTWYKYSEKKLIPKGTRVEMEFWYSNDEERAALAGIRSDRAVRFGGPTTDEMDLAWIQTAPVRDGDTNSGG